MAHLKLEAELPQLRLVFARPPYLGESGVALSEELEFDYKSTPPVVVSLKEAVRSAGTAKICTAISIIDVTPEIEAELCNSLEGNRVKIRTLQPDTLKTIDSHFQRIRAVARSTIVMLNWTHGLDGPPDPYGLAHAWYSSDGNEWFVYSEVRKLSLNVAEATHSIYFQNVRIDEIMCKVEAEAEEPLARQLFREAWSQIGVNPRSALVIGVAAVEVGLRGLVVALVPGTDWRWRPVSQILREILPTLPMRAKLVGGGPITPPPELIKQIENAIPCWGTGSSARRTCGHAASHQRFSLDMRHQFGRTLGDQTYLTRHTKALAIDTFLLRTRTLPCPRHPPASSMAKRPRPVRPPKPEPVAKIVYSPSAKTLASIRRWERLTGRAPAD